MLNIWDRRSSCLDPDKSLTGERVARRLEALRLLGECPEVSGWIMGQSSPARPLTAGHMSTRSNWRSPPRQTDGRLLHRKFNVRFRDECLDANLFTSLAEARKVDEEWRQDYNALRPHSSHGGMSPGEYKKALRRQNLKDPSPNLFLVYPMG